MTNVRGLVLDIDNTVYHHPGYHAAGTQGEVAEVAHILGQSVASMETMFNTRRRDLGIQWGRPATMTETVQSLGVKFRKWNDLRCRVWQPEEWLGHDSDLCRLMRQLIGRYQLCFGTNSPVAIGQRILRVIGIAAVVPDAPVFGPERLGTAKPNPMFFTQIAEELGIPPNQCWSVGDREEVDAIPALAAGYAGACVLPGSRDELVAVGAQLLNGVVGEVVHA